MCLLNRCRKNSAGHKRRYVAGIIKHNRVKIAGVLSSAVSLPV